MTNSSESRKLFNKLTLGCAVSTHIVKGPSIASMAVVILRCLTMITGAASGLTGIWRVEEVSWSQLEKARSLRIRAFQPMVCLFHRTIGSLVNYLNSFIVIRSPRFDYWPESVRIEMLCVRNLHCGDEILPE